MLKLAVAQRNDDEVKTKKLPPAAFSTRNHNSNWSKKEIPIWPLNVVPNLADDWPPGTISHA
jgi:hypothetical protein